MTLYWLVPRQLTPSTDGFIWLICHRWEIHHLFRESIGNIQYPSGVSCANPWWPSNGYGMLRQWFEFWYITRIRSRMKSKWEPLLGPWLKVCRILRKSKRTQPTFAQQWSMYIFDLSWYDRLVRISITGQWLASVSFWRLVPLCATIVGHVFLGGCWVDLGC